MSPQVWRGHALRVETQAGALSQPLRKPGHVAVTLQVVGVQATVGGGEEEEEEEQVEEGKEERGGGGRQVGRTGWRRNNRFEDGETEAGWVEEGEVRVQIDQSIVQTATDERNSSPPRPQCVPRSRRCHLQGPELRHVVETGHRQSADVVVVEGAGEREERETQQQTDSLDSSRLSHEHREVTESAK